MDDADLLMYFNSRWYVDENGCYIWNGARTSAGYGMFYHGWDVVTRRKRKMLAHRWIFREKFGYLPEVVRHQCDRPACVNWERCLLPGTQADNVADMDRRGRRRTRKFASHETPTAILNWDKVREIRRLYATGIYTQAQLGDMFGTRNGAIGKIVRGDSWPEEGMEIGSIRRKPRRGRRFMTGLEEAS